MEYFERLNILINGDDTLITDARFGKDIDDSKLNDLILLLSSIKVDNSSKKFIDKRLIYLMIDIVPTLLLCSDLYDIDKKIQFIEKVYEIHEIILSCFEDEII